jgi:hypothetical protein
MSCQTSDRPTMHKFIVANQVRGKTVSTLVTWSLKMVLEICLHIYTVTWLLGYKMEHRQGQTSQTLHPTHMQQRSPLIPSARTPLSPTFSLTLLLTPAWTCYQVFCPFHTTTRHVCQHKLPNNPHCRSTVLTPFLPGGLHHPFGSEYDVASHI